MIRSPRRRFHAADHIDEIWVSDVRANKAEGLRGGPAQGSSDATSGKAAADDPEVLAQQARGRLRAKMPQLREALRGRVTEHHRFLLRLHLDHLAHLDGLLERLTERIDGLLFPPPLSLAA